MKTIGTILGFIFGAGFGDFQGALAGALVGLFIGFVIQEQQRKNRGEAIAPETDRPPRRDMQSRVGTLEARVAELESRLAQLESGVAPVQTPSSERQAAPSVALPHTFAEPAWAELTPTAQPLIAGVAAPPLLEPGTATAASASPAGAEADADAFAEPAVSSSDVPANERSTPPLRASNSVWAFLTGGNAPVRIGLIVLFFGIAFLVKYVAERVTVPIEFRLAGVTAGGIVMLVLGWKLRAKREAYGLALEGGAVGVLYLTVFAALKLYSLLPPGFAFALLVAIAFFSAVVALRQDALSLALTGALGGFIAPILASSGGGNHVMLFSYYAVLDAGILFLAWHKAWRVLNLVGFGFTALVGAAWGARSWRPELFASTEPFLILFFLMFVAIAVLYALRRSIELKHYVDGTLVFGTPIVAFGMQSQMVRPIEFAAALSALVLAAFYLALSRALYGRRSESLRLLVESFLALGVVFATLAIPLALDGRWTSAAWALEGAAVYWAGLRQQRKLARAFGLLLQPLAAIALIHGWVDQPNAVAVLNSGCLGCIIVALSGWFVSYRMAKPAQGKTDLEAQAAPYVFAWACLWWLLGGLLEIDRLYSGEIHRDVERLFIAFSLAGMSVVGVKLDWRLARLSTLSAPVLFAIQAVVVVLFSSHPFEGLGVVTWPLAFTVTYWLLRRHEDEAVKWLASAWHVGLAWMILALGTRELDWQLGLVGDGAWRYIAWALLPAIALHLAASERPGSLWPLTRWEASYRIVACRPIAVLLWLWGLVVGVIASGSAPPLPFVPVLNPIDLAMAAIALGLLRWSLTLQRRGWLARTGLTIRNVYGLLGVLVFVWFNGTLVRTLHHYAGVPHRFDSMMSSVLVQAALSLFWSLAGVTLMVVAARLSRRAPWFVGVTLMGAVVAKLFLIDLSGVGTVERIVSFIGVGLLLMLVGYFAPMPPAAVDLKKESDA